jgi:hypothetical protein
VEFYKFYFSQAILRAIIASVRLRWTGHVARWGRVNTPFWLEKYKEKVLFGDTTVERAIGVVK